jgi:type VI secretion system protein ImpL
MFVSLHRLFRSRWIRGLFGVLVLSVLIWYCGPLLGVGVLHPLEPEIVRWIAIAALFVLWLVINLLHEVRASRKEKQLAAAVSEPAADPAETEAAEEVALLADRLREALKTLKHGKTGARKRLASLPWYMFIGPPGAGKTTALVNCGLKFPLADSAGGPEALKGVGGTRHCDWWFTDDAVLIDTAGRYTTQDSQADVDSKAWIGFLRLLKKHRRRQPLNGALVAISLADLSSLNEDERMAHARAVRRRVRELQDELGLRIPVYVLFTKADLIAGFVEFFDNMGREERQQVWGVTFPLDEGRDDAGSVAGFPAAFDALLARLNDRMLERVHQETDLQRRRLIYGFPQQVASLREVASEFLTECFRPSRLEARALLRGVYLTSGTQDGTPIDRLLGTMAAEFGLPRQAVPAFSGSGRSYFLTRLIKDVVFGEAGLAGLDPKVERRRTWIDRSVYAGCTVLLLLLAGAWLTSYFGNRALIEEVHASAATYNAQVAELARRGSRDTDLAAVVPALNTLRGIHGGYDERDAAIPVALSFGLYQGGKLGSAANDAYVRALNGLLLPRMLARIETQMLRQMQNPDFLYQALKVYLILGGKHALDSPLVMQWFNADLMATYPADEGAPIREALAAHAEALLRQPLTAPPLSDPLIAQVRAILNREQLADYSYNRIIRSKRSKDLSPWTVAENGGPGSARVFALRSGKGLDTGVPGIYTRYGYHDVFLTILPGLTQDIAEDSWVRGNPPLDIAATVRDTAKLRKDVLGLYLDDYTRYWDAMLADIAVKPFGDLSQALDELSLLSAPASPLRDLLQAIDVQTQLSRQGAADQAVSSAESKAAKIAQKATGLASIEARANLTIQQSQLAGILAEAFGSDSAGKPIDPAKRVDDHFKSLHAFVTPGENQPAPLEASLTKIQQLYQSFNQVANAPNQGQMLLNQIAGASAGLGGAGGGTATGGAAGAAAQLQELTRDMPRPVAAMLQSVSSSSTQIATSGASHEISDAWRSKILPLCDAAFNRYPMVASSSADVPVGDFARLLAPGGLMSQFFDQYLKAFVDTSSHPWRWLSPDQTPLGLSPASLGAFESADQIGQALFPDGTKVQVRFQLVPVSLDPKVAQISIDIAGQTLTWNHGPPEGAWFDWPGKGGKTLVRVTMTPANGGQGQVTDKDGPWALLRLLDTARIVPSGQPDQFRIVFSGGGGTATFDLNASSVNNPFTLGALRSFHCPAKL